MNKKAVTALALSCLMIPAVLLASGCTLGCTQADCQDGTNVTIRGLEPDQLYEVEIVAEEEIVQCTIDTRDQVVVTCANPAYYGQVDEVYIDLIGTPERLTITVRQNEAVIAEDEGTPDYRKVAPNGEVCGPVCRRGEYALAL